MPNQVLNFVRLILKPFLFDYNVLEQSTQVFLLDYADTMVPCRTFSEVEMQGTVKE